MSPQKPNALQRLLRIEPGISLGQWAYDRATENWERIVALFVAGGGMSYLASITEAVRPWGPLGIGVAGLLSAMTAWISLGLAQSFRAKAALRKAEGAAITKWHGENDTVNPLAPEFHTKRLKWLNIAHPVNGRISGKRFIDCEILGPANIFMLQNCELSGVTFVACDFVVVKEGGFANNVYPLEGVKIFGGSIWRSTILLPEAMVPVVGRFANFITKTGHPELDATPGRNPLQHGQDRPSQSGPHA